MQIAHLAELELELECIAASWKKSGKKTTTKKIQDQAGDHKRTKWAVANVIRERLLIACLIGTQIWRTRGFSPMPIAIPMLPIAQHPNLDSEP